MSALLVSATGRPPRGLDSLLQHLLRRRSSRFDARVDAPRTAANDEDQQQELTLKALCFNRHPRLLALRCLLLQPPLQALKSRPSSRSVRPLSLCLPGSSEVKADQGHACSEDGNAHRRVVSPPEHASLSTLAARLTTSSRPPRRVGLTIGFIFGNFAILSCVQLCPCRNHPLADLECLPATHPQWRSRPEGLLADPVDLHALVRCHLCLLHVEYGDPFCTPSPVPARYQKKPPLTLSRTPAVGTVIRTDGLTMQDWAAQQVREGRAIGMPTSAAAAPRLVPAVRERLESREKN